MSTAAGTHSHTRKHKKQSFENWLVQKRLPKRVWVSQYVYIENGEIVVCQDLDKHTDALQHYCDPRYEYENTLPVRPSTPEDHAAILKQEAGGMYGW